MSEFPHKAGDPIAADAEAKRTAAIRAWQKERLEDLASGRGGFAHIEPSELAPPATLPPTDEPPAGLVGGPRQAVEIIASSLSAEPQSVTNPPPSASPSDRPGEPSSEPGEAVILPDTIPDEETPTSPAPAGQLEVADPPPGSQYTLIEKRIGDEVKESTDQEFDAAMVKEVSASEKRTALRILVYETIWLAALTGTLLALPMLRILPGTAQLISAGLIGALGGTVGAVAALWKPTSFREEAEVRHQVWYISQPVIGFPLGMFVFLVLHTTVVYSAGTGSAVLHPALIYVACAYAGFRQDILTGFGSLFHSRATRK